MEEVDKIIIHTLKDIGCGLDEDMKGLGELSTELIYEASVRCARVIIPELKLPLKLPENMAARFQHSASLAEACKSIGYKGEIGYQTFLYSNVVELRKVLMFLIDKLPREAEKTTSLPQDSLSKTKGIIASVLKTQLGRRSKPEEIGSVPFVSVPLETGITLPGKNTNVNPQEWREYCRNHLGWLTEQCSRQELFASVCRLLDSQELSLDHGSSSGRVGKPAPPPRPRPKPKPRGLGNAQPDSRLHLATPLPTPRQRLLEDLGSKKEEEESRDAIAISEEDKEMKLIKELEQCSHRVAETQLALSVLSDKLSQLKGEVETMSGDKLKRFEARQRAATLLTERDATIVSDAQRKVSERKEKMAALNKQWEAHSKPLVDAIAEISIKTATKQSEEEQQYSQLEELNQQIDGLNQQIALKIDQKAKLEVELAKAPKEIHRSMYTQRILEIIGSIKKQKDDIDKILRDTRQVQKEITLTSGKLDRSYTVVDELIFKNAKRDEHSRRAYKLLATLHGDCSDIVSFIRETGALVREISDIQEQIETESNKKVGASLQRLTSDLKQMRQETEMLKTQLETLA